MTGLGHLVGNRAVVGAGGADRADEIEWVRQWWDLGALVWAVAAAAVLVWLGLMVAMGRWLGPRRIRAGLGELGLPGDEPPALVNLLTSRWTLDREAVPATLLDLAARREVTIRLEGTRTGVHVPEERVVRGGVVEQLAPYEAQVLDHVRTLAERTDHRTVPVAALTTGSRAHSRGWWVRFRREVRADAKQRGLARKRWSGRHKLVLFAASLVPAGALGFALATAVYDVREPNGNALDGSAQSDAYLIYAGLIYAGLALIGFAVASFTRSGVTDTLEGRDQAARWLGWRETTAKDPLFKDHTAAKVDLWGRKLSYGAAVGLADGAVRGLALGPENQRRLWSSVGGHWREVRVSRPPLNGAHPAAALLFGVLATGSSLLLLMLLVQAGSGAVFDGLALLPMAVIGVVGAIAFIAGLLAIALPRRDVAGQVLTIRKKGLTRSDRWHVVTDDGTSRRLRAWWMDSQPRFGVDAVVRTKISRGLRHAGEVHVEGGAETAVDDDGSSAAMPGSGTVAEMHVRPVTRQVLTLTARTGGVEHDGTDPPKLPDAAALTDIVGRTVELHIDATVDDSDGQTGTYKLGEGLAYATWTNSEVFKKMRRPRFLTREVDGVGDEAYRLRVGGTLFARKGAAVLMVTAHLPGEGTERDRMSAALACHCLEDV